MLTLGYVEIYCPGKIAAQEHMGIVLQGQNRIFKKEYSPHLYGGNEGNMVVVEQITNVTL